MRSRTFHLALAGLLLAGAALTVFTKGTPVAQAQRPPALSGEELLRLVLPADAAGRRPGVIAWARTDASSTPEAAPQVFVVVLYRVQEQSELRRLATRVRWNGRAYEPESREASEVLSGEPAWLGLSRWSVEIAVSSNQSEANPICTVTYRGAGPLDGRIDASLTLTELFRPDASLLWNRITALSEIERSIGVELRRSISVTYRLETPERGASRLIANVSEATPDQIQQFEEVYVFDGVRYELASRTPHMAP